MLKTLLFDMDDTLCDTGKANAVAEALLSSYVENRFSVEGKGDLFAAAYIKGIYRDWSDEQKSCYWPIIQQQGESAFRLQLIRDLLMEFAGCEVDAPQANAIQQKFDQDRIDAFDFYPGISEFLAEARKVFTLVVITNGPEFSQIPKVERVKLSEHVDHIIIGGQEPEQKPAKSIFDKALALAGCKAHEAIHVGDSLAADIAGAHNSHITSVWIQHQQPLDAELGLKPHHTLFHPDEIPKLVWDLHGG